MAEPAIITRSGIAVDLAIAIPRGTDASGRHIPYQCVLGVAVALEKPLEPTLGSQVASAKMRRG
jgi:hypothetical protein